MRKESVQFLENLVKDNGDLFLFVAKDKKEIKAENARKTFTCKITKESIPEEDFYDLYYFISQFLIARAEIERTYLKVINTEQFVISTQFNNNYIYYYRGNINITNNYYESVIGKVV